MDLKPTIEHLDREIEKKRHSDMMERQDVTIGLLAKLDDSVSELQASIQSGATQTSDAVSSLSNDIKGMKIETPTVNVSVPDVNVPEIKVPDITVNVPEVKLPTITVPNITIPEIKLPTINVPKPEVTVNVPEIKIPTIKVPKIEMPDKMTIKGDVGLKDVDKTHPLPVTMVDEVGKPVGLGGGTNIGGLKKTMDDVKVALTTTLIDSTTNSVNTVDYSHHEIHSGSHYFVVGVQSLAINQVLDFTWVMPNTTKWTHWLWKLNSEAQTAWYVYENAVATNPLATAVTPLNSHRNSTNTSGTTMRYEVQANLVAANADTSVVGATLLKSGIAGSGNQVGGETGRESELVLKQGATYCLRAIATAAGYVNFDMEWYEHTNK
jgi:hypothetical protein